MEDQQTKRYILYTALIATCLQGIFFYWAYLQMQMMFYEIRPIMSTQEVVNRWMMTGLKN